MARRASVIARRPPTAVARWGKRLLDDKALGSAYADGVVEPVASRLAAIERARPLLINLAAVDWPERAAKRRLVSWIISDPHFQWEEVEAAAGIASPDLRFRAAVVDALSLCLFLQLLNGTEKWRSDLRRVWLKIAARAEAALAAAEGLLAAAEELTAALASVPEYSEDPPRELRLTPVSAHLGAWATVAREQADALRGVSRGGRPPMLVFASLIGRLAAAFEDATGRKGVLEPHSLPLPRTLPGDGRGGVAPAVGDFMRGRVPARAPRVGGSARRGHFPYSPTGQNPAPQK